MKKSTLRRPELESLETMLLMSTVSAEAHHAAKAVAPVGSVQLEGTFPLQRHSSAATRDYPAETVLSGTGNLAGMGRALVVVPVSSLPGSPEGFEVLIYKQSIGVYLAPISLPAKGSSISVPYVAEDGASFNGNDLNTSGTVTISDIVGKNAKDHYVLKLS